MKILVFNLIALLFVGCVTNGQATIEQKEVLIKNTAKTAIFIAIKETSKKDNAQTIILKAQKIKTIILNDIEPLVNNNVPSFNLIQILSDKLPTEYVLLMQNAVDLLNLYVHIPAPSQSLDEESLRLVKAFLNGIKDGCDLTIQITNGG